MQKRTYGFIYCILLLLTSSYSELKAQVIENNINLYGMNFPHEKIHIHFDKESYLPGETIWFKAYLFEEDLPSERSTNFYAALYDENGRLIQQYISPIFISSANGYFNIPDTLRSTRLICRAYTTWMLNFDTAFLFTKTIKLINSTAASASLPAGQEEVRSAKTVSLRFFPEGGDMIDGLKNTIAFKASYDNGLPFQIEGVLKKQETGETLMPLKSLHDGMGKFDIEIQPGEKYYAEWLDNNGTMQQTWLPVAKTRGVSLKLSVQKNKLFFNVVNRTGADSLHVLMYMYQKVFYKTSIVVPPAAPFTGMVPVIGLPAGVMQLTVFDAGWQPVAERVAFISNDSFSMNAVVIAKEISVQKRGKNQLEILMADTIPSNMSLSISDADLNAEAGDNNIISDLLLKGDIRGYIHNPAWYFATAAADDSALKAGLDLVMLTNGWRRYNWADMAMQKMPVMQYPADEYLGVYGQISKELMEKAGKEEHVNLIIKTIDSTNYFYTIRPDEAGLLKQTGLVFYDSAKIYFSFNKNKKYNSQIAFGKFNFTYPVPGTINNYRDQLLRDTAGSFFNQNTALFKYYTDNNGIKKFNDEKTLQTVVVKTGGWNNWKNNPLLKMDDRYASGMFSGGATGYSFDVVHDERSWTAPDIFTYIRNTVPGLMVGTLNFNNFSTGRPLIYDRKTVLVYIDEHEMTTAELETLSLSQVAYIKLIPNFTGRGPDPGGTGINPALSVYTRKGDDLVDRRPTEKDLGVVKIAGYSPVKEFYSPDYSVGNTTTGTDARTTLLWMPYIFTDAGNRTVPITFYNNDFTKKFRVVLEGINERGKMIHIEKIIE